MNENKEISFLLTLPKDVIENHIAPYLDLQDLINLYKTYKDKNYFFKPLQFLLFLHLVAFGKQEKVEEILKKDSELLNQSGTVKDYSGRIFKNITAFQYALWALDTHMWTLLMKHLSKDEVKNQLQSHLKDEKEYKKSHGIHYDFAPLINALQTYLDNSGNCSDKQQNEYWCTKVGGEQRLVPAHVANEYCREGESFNYSREFKEDNLPRCLTFFNVKKHNLEQWFPLQKKGVGFDLAIYSGGRHSKSTGASGDCQMFNPLICQDELIGLEKLRDVRTEEVMKLKKELLGSDLKQEEEDTNQVDFIRIRQS